MQISRTRLAQILSVNGMHRESAESRLQELQAEALQMGIERHAFRGSVGSLTPTSQVTHRAKQHEAIQIAKAFPGIAEAEVATPAFAPAVDVVDHLTDGDETPLGPGQLSNPIVCTGHRLGRGKYVEITLVATEKVAVVSQRKTQKVQALARFVQLDYLRFLAVDGELESAFKQSFDPVDQLPGLIASQNHEVISIPHQLGIGPATGTVRTVEPFLEPVQVEIRQQRGNNAPNNVAKSSLIPDSIITRAQLRPKYGQGWQPRLGAQSRQGDIRDLGKEESP
jgi:hypothetical protein